MSLPSCCEFHFGEEDACRQGKDCPCRDEPLYAPLRHRTEDKPDDTLYEPWGPDVYIAAVLAALALVCFSGAVGWLLYQLWMLSPLLGHVR